MSRLIYRSKLKAMRHLVSALLLALPLAAQTDDLAACQQSKGAASAEFGLCLLKAGDQARKLGRNKEALHDYSQAVKLLPGRSETAGALLYLGISQLSSKTPTRGMELLDQAQSLDSSLYGPVQMWLALHNERINQLEEAESHYKAALAAESGNADATLDTTMLYKRFLEQHGREDEARALQAHLPARDAHPGAPVPKMSVGGAYRVGGSVSQPKLTQKVEPNYSEEARAAKYSASVLVQLVVGADGLPHDIRVVRPAGLGLDDQAVQAVGKWQFQPGEKDGNPVSVYATVEVNFRLL